MEVLLSIKPKYVRRIIAGQKKYEFRKSVFKKEEVREIVVYSSSPEKKIIGTFQIGGILEETPEKIWDLCKNEAGIDRGEFFAYFKEKPLAYALQIQNFTKFPQPIDPYKINPDFKPPQSYCYFNLSDFQGI